MTPKPIPPELFPPLLNSDGLTPLRMDANQQPPRWKKRALAIGIGVSLLTALFWETSPRTQLSRSTESISGVLDPAIQSVARQIDAAIDSEIEKQHLVKAQPADWRTVARRISLAMIGNGLSLEELRVLEQIPEPQRLIWWTEYLLQDRRWADYLAERWTRATVGTNQGPFLIFRRRKYVDWLADQFEKGSPYDVIARQLLEAQGSWTDAPQVNFLTATMDDADNKKPDAIRLAGRTSRAFLAQRIDCLQCHQDYLGKVSFSENSMETGNEQAPSAEAPSSRMGEQADFHQLAAFFAGIRLENPFVGLRNSTPEYRVKYLNEETETAVVPSVPYRRDLLPETGDARHRLAVWVTHPENKAFARATVNRMWAVLFGKPLVEPIDSIPLSGPFPPGLERLADDFAANGYNLKRLIRTILCTEVYHRDSRIDQASPDGEMELDERYEQHWAIFPLTQLRPEQVAASIHQASRVKAIDENSSILSQIELFTGVNDFTKAYGDRGDDEFNPQSVTIPQRLLVMNGSFVSERIKHNPVLNASTRIAELTSDDRTAIETAFLSVLNRLPSELEIRVFGERLSHSRGPTRSAEMSSVFWSLMNSTEFQWNH
ncbi:MAG: DUF1553 domain-containing protein [Pirellula staleyi]